jgi:hypothetical protein
MHRHAVAGLQEGWDYYPALIEVMAADLHLLGRKSISKDDIERCLHDLDDSDGVITDALKLGNYYGRHRPAHRGASVTLIDPPHRAFWQVVVDQPVSVASVASFSIFSRRV